MPWCAIAPSNWQLRRPSSRTMATLGARRVPSSCHGFAFTADRHAKSAAIPMTVPCDRSDFRLLCAKVVNLASCDAPIPALSRPTINVIAKGDGVGVVGEDPPHDAAAGPGHRLVTALLLRAVEQVIHLVVLP